MRIEVAAAAEGGEHARWKNARSPSDAAIAGGASRATEAGESTCAGGDQRHATDRRGEPGTRAATPGTLSDESRELCAVGADVDPQLGQCGKRQSSQPAGAAPAQRASPRDRRLGRSDSAGCDRPLVGAAQQRIWWLETARGDRARRSRPDLADDFFLPFR